MLASAPPETWSVRKPAVIAHGGVVASQHWRASRAGAEILASGGNAVDAAVATGLAIGTVEPWMSGIGGGGFMVVYLAKEHRSYAIEFGMRSSAEVDPADYPVMDGAGPDLFAWPAVLDHRNVSGPLSVAVPGTVAGLADALESFGTRSWSDVLAPAIAFADEGLIVDWYATLKIASAARDLARFDESRRVYLPHGFAPVAEWAGLVPRILLGRLPQTLKRLAEVGPRDFYTGRIARDIVADARHLGIRLNADDLAGYAAHISPVGRSSYRHAEVDIVPGLTAGPTLRHALSLLDTQLEARATGPDADAYMAYANCLFDAYEHRLAYIGDVPETYAPSCTTHISVADREGNVVALTITLLSLFGSKVMLPGTGILMNNGIMWFDPRPDRPNSIQPSRRPLSNMCPIVLLGDDGKSYALGASGGRRIMPAVFQLISYLTDYRMTLDEATHFPRIDVSGTDTVTVDKTFPKDVHAALGARYKTRTVPSGVYPNSFACPNMVCHDPESDTCTGASFVMSPWSAAWPEPETGRHPADS